jgi:hypothetical protein
MEGLGRLQWRVQNGAVEGRYASARRFDDEEQDPDMDLH